MRYPLPAVLLAALLAGACAGPADSTAPLPKDPAPANPVHRPGFAPFPGLAAGKDARADEIVRAMSDALKNAKTFSVRVEAWSDEASADGTLVALSAETRLLVRRPDGLYAERATERGLRRIWYDGRTFAVLDVAKNLFARAEAPPTIEKTIDMLAERFGLVMPLADLLADDPYDSYTRAAARVDYLGTQPVRGVPCHHVSFSAPWLQWQIWIAAEGDPLPRRVQITYIDEPGEPRFLCNLDDWKLGVPANAADFTFVAPPDSREIEVSPAGPAGRGAAGKSR